MAPRSDEGKSLASDIFTKQLLPKPYMYLSRLGLSTLKKKLDARESVTFNEYVSSYIKMIRDPRSELHGPLDAHLEHIQQVVEDAAIRDWPTVRRWSQAMFDAVETGALKWEDRVALQLDRMQYAIAATRSQQPHLHTERRDIPCKDFNGHVGCIHPKSHMGRTVNFVHVCAMCFSAGDRSPHPAHTCPRRQQVQPQPPAPRYQQSAAPMQHPKNGPSAPQLPRMVGPVMTYPTTQ